MVVHVDGHVKYFVGKGPFCKRVASPTPPPPKTLLAHHRKPRGLIQGSAD